MKTPVNSPPSSAAQEASTTTAPQFRAAVVTPLASERYKLQVTVARDTHEKLQRAQALARHTLPSGDVASILDRALTLLIDDLERRRFARAASPRPSPGGSTVSGRHIPAVVRRAVWQRDEGRCAFRGRTGRCRETAFLEFHHVAPYAAGGAATADNIQLRCRAHNQYEARLFFGDWFVRERQEVWAMVITYYPSAREAAEAKPVVVSVKAPATANIVLVPARLSDISGIVIGSDGQPVRGGTFGLTHGDGLFGLDSIGVVIRPDGTFLAPGLPPGTYHLQFREGPWPPPHDVIPTPSTN